MILTLLQACDSREVRPPSEIEEEQQQKMEHDREKDPREMDETELKDQQRREADASDVNFTPANQKQNAIF